MAADIISGNTSFTLKMTEEQGIINFTAAWLLGFAALLCGLLGSRLTDILASRLLA